MRSLVAFSGHAGVPSIAVSWTGMDAVGRTLVLAHTEAAVAVATNEQRTVRAVLAGSLANGRQLRTALTGRHAVAGRDDAEVVAHLYEERGIQCVKALRGGFALALWDQRLQRLLIARDQLGLVPLYYVADDGRLAVASRLPVVAALPGLGGTWDATALDAFVTLGCVPPPATFHTGIRQLGPGELAVWEDGRLRTQRYWQLTFPERRMLRSDVPAALREQVTDAVRLRQAGVVAGMLLSGGLDAAAVLALTRGEGPTPARAYTGTFAHDDDGRQAARLAARAGIEHVVVDAAHEWRTAIEALLEAHGGPVAGPELAAVHLAAVRARADVGVVLAGLGGEEVFGGSLPVRSAEQLRRYRDLPAVAREAAELWARVAPADWATGVRRLVLDQRLAPLELYGRRACLLLPEERRSLYTPEALAVLGEAGPWSVLSALFADAVSCGAVDALDALHHVELTLRLPARAAALGAACAGLDVRIPLADHRLAQFVASVPAPRRGTARERQLLLRAALKDAVPAAVARRPHAVTVPPASAWTAVLDELLSPARVAAQGFFRPEVVSRLRDEHVSGRRDHAARLWAIMLATHWLERQPMPEAVREAG